MPKPPKLRYICVVATIKSALNTPTMAGVLTLLPCNSAEAWASRASKPEPITSMQTSSGTPLRARASN
jgi:hypothetical protein